MMITEPKVLIISNKFDFSTDLITNKLGALNVSFLRLNRDQLHEYQIRFNPILPELIVIQDGVKFRFTEETLFSVYFRAPTFLRDIVQENLNEEEQLYRTQWAAFVRALSVFEQVKWVNNPISTYKAEIKALQLKYAKQTGFLVPETLISNITEKSDQGLLALKSIDTAIISTGNTEAFVYTTIVDGLELENAVYSSPFFIQKALTPKMDIRITVIDSVAIAVKIKCKGGIDGDWRKHAGTIDYEVFSLPESVRRMCIEYSRRLNLNFAAIDMVIFRDEYYFIEVNPTGEWAWLQKNTGYDFCSLIAKSLYNEDVKVGTMKIWGDNFISQHVLPDFYVRKVDKVLKEKYEAISKINDVEFPKKKKEELLKSLTKDLDNQNERKKGLEDKVKAILFAVTISISTMTFSLSYHSYSMNSVMGIIVFSLLIISIYYFVSSAILAVKIMIPIGFHMIQTKTSFDLERKKIIVELEGSSEHLKSLIKDKELNDNINLRISNSTYAALKLLRNGIIIFAFYFIAAQFQKRVEVKDVTKPVSINHDTGVAKKFPEKESSSVPVKTESVLKMRIDSAEIK